MPHILFILCGYFTIFHLLYQGFFFDFRFHFLVLQRFTYSLPINARWIVSRETFRLFYSKNCSTWKNSLEKCLSNTYKRLKIVDKISDFEDLNTSKNGSILCPIFLGVKNPWNMKMFNACSARNWSVKNNSAKHKRNDWKKNE